MTPAFDPTGYRIEITQRIIAGDLLFEGRVAHLPGVVIYGTTEAAALADTRYELSLWHALAFPNAEPPPPGDGWSGRR